MRAICLSFAGVLSFSVVLLVGPSDSPSTLRIYFVDVEGGQATLFVTPAGQTLLIDTGWSGNGGRDANRIFAAAKDAGLSKLDYVLITHYHDDHVGGAAQLAARIPISAFIDHGDNTESTDAEAVAGLQTYQQLLAAGRYKRIIAKPGDSLPLQGVKATAVTADGSVLQSSLPGAGSNNPYCASSPQLPADESENLRSLGTFFEFGKLRVLDLGDLTADKERELMCPSNKLGHVDIYIASHHGSLSSGSTLLVHAINPRVAVIDNGAKKGGSPFTWDIMHSSPHIEAIWQLHFSEAGGFAHNAPTEFIANPDGSDAGHYLKLNASADGSFDIFNSRTGKTQRYAAIH